MGRRVIPKNVRMGAIKAYVADGKTLKQVANEFGINQESLRRWLGDKVRPRGYHFKKSSGYKKSDSTGETSSVVAKAVSVKDKKSKVRVTSKLGRSNARWTPTEDEILRDAVLSGMTVGDTVEILERTPIAISCRKVHLIENGFIQDPSKRFTVPTGIKRTRKPMANVFGETEVETVIIPETTKEIEVEVENSTETPLSVPSIELSDLAKLVKEFGVNITVSVTSKGMEVKMCS